MNLCTQAVVDPTRTINNMAIAVGDLTPVSQFYQEFTDDVSLQYGNGFDMCGTRYHTVQFANS
jgi:hypothetical protein